MKLILDFDDVIFDTKSFKVTIFSGLRSYGIDAEVMEKEYSNYRNSFNLFKFYKEVSLVSGVNMSQEDLQLCVDKVLEDVSNHKDERLINLIRDIGGDNCFILTAGEEEFQKRKIDVSGLLKIIPEQHIIVVNNSKKEILRDFCERYPDESIIFVDDTKRHIDDANSLLLSNLFPVLYDMNGFETLSYIIDTHRKYKNDFV